MERPQSQSVIPPHTTQELPNPTTPTMPDAGVTYEHKTERRKREKKRERKGERERKRKEEVRQPGRKNPAEAESEQKWKNIKGSPAPRERPANARSAQGYREGAEHDQNGG